MQLKLHQMMYEHCYTNMNKNIKLHQMSYEQTYMQPKKQNSAIPKGHINREVKKIRMELEQGQDSRKKESNIKIKAVIFQQCSDQHCILFFQTKLQKELKWNKNT